MKGKLIPMCLCLYLLSGLMGTPVRAQEPVHTRLQDQVRDQLRNGTYALVDFVEVALRTQKGQDTLCTLKFREEWQIQPKQHAISKSVLAHDSSCMNLFLMLPERNGRIAIRNLSYEFNLLDPHLLASGNVAFPEPDSMDLPTRQLQSDLIALIMDFRDPGDRYRYEEQLLSVIFYEEWSIDPSTTGITKKVKGLSPVIWQRRQTTDGEPVNDGDTGLPVYYKNELERIDLRKP